MKSLESCLVFLSSATKICRESEYSCGLPMNQCVPQSWHCDGKADCDNGADEDNCSTSHRHKHRDDSPYQ